MRLAPARADQVDDLVAARRKQLRDQAPVAASPERLRAHEAGARLGQSRRERLLPGVRSHPGRVAAKRANPDAAEPFLARLPAAPPAELLRVPVGDPGLGQRGGKRSLSELRVPPRPGEAPYVDQRSHMGVPEEGDKLFGRTGTVADGEEMSTGGVHRQHYNVTFTLLALAATSYALLQSMVAPALLTIQHDLDTTASGAAWILSAYLLSASVVTPIAGRLGDRFGKK
jgi:Major Facilitator Superfamily